VTRSPSQCPGRRDRRPAWPIADVHSSVTPRFAAERPTSRLSCRDWISRAYGRAAGWSPSVSTVSPGRSSAWLAENSGWRGRLRLDTTADLLQPRRPALQSTTRYAPAVRHGNPIRQHNRSGRSAQTVVTEDVHISNRPPSRRSRRPRTLGRSWHREEQRISDRDPSNATPATSCSRAADRPHQPRSDRRPASAHGPPPRPPRQSSPGSSVELADHRDFTDPPAARSTSRPTHPGNAAPTRTPTPAPPVLPERRTDFTTITQDDPTASPANSTAARRTLPLGHPHPPTRTIPHPNHLNRCTDA